MMSKTGLTSVREKSVRTSQTRQHRQLCNAEKYSQQDVNKRRGPACATAKKDERHGEMFYLHRRHKVGQKLRSSCADVERSTLARADE